MPELIKHIICGTLGMGFFAVLCDYRLLNPKRHWHKLQAWSCEFEAKISQETCYKTLLSMELEFFRKFQSAGKKIHQDTTNKMYKRLYKLLQDRKQYAIRLEIKNSKR